MKGSLIFIFGFVAGILFTLFIIFIIGIGIRSNYTKDKVQVQCINIKGKKGNAELYTGMPKDSVLILVGKPDEVRLNSYGNFTTEVWGYKLNNKIVSDLEIDFEDGKLKGVRQD
jgi:hypothetical protein